MLPPSTSTPTLPPSLSQMDFNQSNNQQQEMQQQYPPYSHPSPSTSTLPPPLTSSTSTPNLGSPLTLSNTSSLPPTVTSPSSYLYYPPLPSPRHHPYIKPPLLLHTHSDLGQLPTTNTTSPTNLTPTSDPSSANPFAFSSPSAPSPPVRNHSAPGHILTLSSVLQSQIGETVSTGGGQHPLSNIETIPSQPLSTPTLDWSMSNPPNPSSSEDSYFQQPVFSSPISAISLVRNRLPILEAALVGSAKDVGNDEDEIWKGVEGAFEELKRVMSGRREVRRVLAGGGGGVQAGKGAKRTFATMDLSSSTSSPTSSTPSASSPITSQSVNQEIVRAQAQVLASQLGLQKAHAVARAEEELRERELILAQAQAQQQHELALQAQQQQQQHELALQAQQQQQQQQMLEQQAYQQAQAQHHHQMRLAQQEQEFRLAQQAVAQAQIQQYNPGSPFNPSTTPNPGTPSELPPGGYQFSSGNVGSGNQQQNGFGGGSVGGGGSGFDTPPQSQPSIIPLQPQQQFSSLPPQPPPAPPPTPFTLPNQFLPQQPQFSQQPPQQQQSFLPPSFPPDFTPQDLSLPPGASGGIGEMSTMGSLMQLHLSSSSFSLLPSDQDSPMTDSLPTSLTTRTRQNSSSTTSSSYAALTAAVTGVLTPSRPSRSRAASGSGYISASGTGSRSRAASGSGYQSLLESRSRAASSASSVFGMYERDDEDDDDDFQERELELEGLVGGMRGGLGGLGGMGGAMNGGGVEVGLRTALDPIFLEFLDELCSNLDATDSKGEIIHQTLMPKKMERLDQSQDFRPFKFRIQAFTSAFQEKLAICGYSENDVPFKKVRQYLWAQPCISRFNDDGKKAKSKGNHIWSIEAKKLPDKRWMFREFSRCIKGSAPAVAFCGLPWSWSPRVWDPQCSVSAIGAVFSSPSLPSWLSWNDNVLSGQAPDNLSGQSIEIRAVATFQLGTKVQQLETSCTVLIASVGDDHTRFTEDGEHKPSLSRSDSMPPSPQPNHSAPTFMDHSPPTHHPDLTAMLDHQMKMEEGNNTNNNNNNNNDGNIASQEQQAALHQHYLDQQAHAHQIQMQQSREEAMHLHQAQQIQQQQQEQAQLHQHYANLSSLGSPFASNNQNNIPSPSSMSYVPSPDLVASALQRAAFDREQNAQSPYAMDALSRIHLNSEVNTPGVISPNSMHAESTDFGLPHSFHAL